jgi:hypothetical protein
VWEKQFDDDYIAIESMRPEAIGRDFMGWASMYDRSDIDRGEMNEWLEDTIKVILNGGESGHVLEIGTGSGMILFNLTQGLQSYIGLEPSAKAVRFVSRVAESIPTLAGKVKIFNASAADIGQLGTPLSPDLAILNSVVQYFPSQAYLLKFLQDLVQLEGVKTIFFGDIRSYTLYKDFLASRALHIAGKGATISEIQRIIDDMEKGESELLIDPAFFTALPYLLPGKIEHVEILPKKILATNELSCYRYAAVVHVKAHNRKEPLHVLNTPQDGWINFKEQGLDRQSLSELLQTLSRPVICVSNIPYSKIIFDKHIVDLLNDKNRCSPPDENWLSSVSKNAQRCPSLSAVDLIEVAQQAGYRVEISWARQYSQRGGLDAIFHRHEINSTSRVMFRFPFDRHDDLGHHLSSQPLRNQLKQRAQIELRNLLHDELPSYMIPQVITILDKMPINQNGKIDRQALLNEFHAENNNRGPVRQPVSATECQMQRIWAQVLNIKPHTIGMDASFFHLGGNSVSAIKVVAEAKRVGIKITVENIFRHPLLKDLADYIINITNSKV